MKQEIWNYPDSGPTMDAKVAKTKPVGATREWFAFFVSVGHGSDDLVVRLHYWHAERKAKNGRWVTEESYNWHDRNRNRHSKRERPCVPLALGIAVLRAVSGRIRMETPEEARK